MTTVNGSNGSNGSPGLTKKDFASDQETRWCPGCGDYAILATVQQFLPELGLPPVPSQISPSEPGTARK